MIIVIPPLDVYEIEDVESLLTPALLIYPEIVDSNITVMLNILDGDANRWRPHIKTAKLAAVLHQLLARGVVNLKCSTTLELLTACEAGATDVLLAYSTMGANAKRVLAIAEHFPAVRISVLVESAAQADAWHGTNIGMFVDVNPGMDRTGVPQAHLDRILHLAEAVGDQFRGVHYYDGHVSGFAAEEREKRAHSGYDQLLKVVEALSSAGIPVEEVTTSGTPAVPSAVSYTKFRNASFIHRVSPGTVVFNDSTSVAQLPDYDFQPAAIVLSTVVSHPTPHSFTCDAGHKSVSADAGVPTCTIIGQPQWTALKPSEEHLPIEDSSGKSLPGLGEKIYLAPRHVCPTVNNFDEALMVVKGRVRCVEPVSARGHESPMAAIHSHRHQAARHAAVE